MKSPCPILPLLLLLLIATTIESRENPGAIGEYWRIATKDQSMPEAIQARIAHKNSDTKSKCEEGTNLRRHEYSFTQDFEPIPDATAYPDDHPIRATLAKDFEPIRAHEAVTASNNYGKFVGPKLGGKQFAQDFEPIPQATGYNV